MRVLHHLQILHDEEVEREICQFLPQIEPWLLGTLPLPTETRSGDPGVVFPVIENVDTPLAFIRRMIYEGTAGFTLLRTRRTTNTPINFSRAVYTVLRVEGEPKIGGIPLGLAKSIWIEQPAFVDAGFIFMVSKPAEILVGKDAPV